MSKAELRQTITRALGALGPTARSEASRDAVSRLTALDAWRTARTVMFYMPLAREIDPAAAVEAALAARKRVLVPRIDIRARTMEAVTIESLDPSGFETDAIGTLTPRDGTVVPPDDIDLVVVPGMCFDESGWRLGRGAGYYDRFLRRLRPSAVRVGLAFDLQVLDEVPVEPHDVRMHYVVSEGRTLDLRAM
jgi:5-formyltetrahydrofolate cyclo-ligase